MAKRKVLWIDAADLHAGSIIVVDEGGTRRYYHVCEVARIGNNVTFVYNVTNGYEREQCDADDMLRVRIKV